jgi:hypothetical protein
LSQEGGGQTRVETPDAVVLEYVNKGAAEGGRGGGRAGLKTDFYCSLREVVSLALGETGSGIGVGEGETRT